MAWFYLFKPSKISWNSEVYSSRYEEFHSSYPFYPAAASY